MGVFIEGIARTDDSQQTRTQHLNQYVQQENKYVQQINKTSTNVQFTSTTGLTINQLMH
jgi:hypothetical protein